MPIKPLNARQRRPMPLPLRSSRSSTHVQSTWTSWPRGLQKSPPLAPGLRWPSGGIAASDKVHGRMIINHQLPFSRACEDRPPGTVLRSTVHKLHLGPRRNRGRGSPPLGQAKISARSSMSCRTPSRLHTPIGRPAACRCPYRAAGHLP